MWILEEKKRTNITFLSLLAHGESQVVVGHLDLVLGLQVSHPLGADAVNGHDDITLHQVALRRLAARRDLSKHKHKDF